MSVACNVIAKQNKEANIFHQKHVRHASVKLPAERRKIHEKLRAPANYT